MKNILRGISCLMIAMATLPATAQERRWVFQCSVKDCHTTYSESMRFIESEMNDVWEWFTGMGYDQPYLKLGTGRGWRNDSSSTLAPQVNLLDSIAFEGVAIAHYDPSSQWIEINTGASNSFLLQIQQLATGVVPEGQPKLEKARKRRIRSTLAHEFYHALQYGDNRDVGDIPWIIEGTATAAGMSWLRKNGDKLYEVDQFYDEPLHLDEGTKEYQRAHFFYYAGHKIIPHEPMATYADMYEEVTEDLSKLQSYEAVDKTFQAHGSRFHDVYNHVVAEHANHTGYYNKLANEIQAPSRDGTQHADNSLVEAWTSEARLLKVLPSALKPPATPEPGRAELALVTIEIPEGAAPDHVGLAVEYDWVKPRKATYLFDLVEKEIDYLVRVTNINRLAVPDTVDHDVTVALRVSPVSIELPSCIARSETVELVVEGVPDDFNLELSAKNGRVTDGRYYTAPASGDDAIFVRAHVDRRKQEKVKLLEVKPRNKGCPFQLVSADGFSFTYDPDTETTLAKDPSGRHLAYFDREFIYVDDPSMGLVKMHKSVMQRFGKQMLGDTASFLSASPLKGFEINAEKIDQEYAEILNNGADPFAWGRAPYDFLSMLQYPVLNMLSSHFPERMAEVKNPDCPAVAPRCRIIEIDGRDRMVYGSGNRLSLMIMGDGQTHQVRQASGPIKAPGNARLIKF